MTVGAALCGLGGSAAVAYWIYSLEEGKRFFVAAGWISLALLATGLALLVIGFLRSRDERATQRQRGGRESTNLQAGGDIRIGGDQ